MIGTDVDGLVALLEAQRVRAVVAGSQCNELVALLDSPGRQLRKHPGDELVVSADDVELLVVSRQWIERAPRVEAGQVDEIQSRLISRVAAVLRDGVCEHQAPEA